jgi:zinc transport system substrate-binding protein
MSRTALRMLAATAAVGVVAAGCGAGSSEPGGEQSKPMVVAAFYPLAFAAETVGEDLVDVENLTATGVEPHDLELSADQVASLSEADLVVFLGEGFQPAVEDAVSGFDESRILNVVEGENLRPGEEDEEGGDGSTVDPHVWLDPSIMAAIVDEVAARLAQIDPAHRETYEANAQELNSRLAALDRDYSEALSSCGSRDIVTSHAAFGYLAERYDLNQVSISGIDPEAEPSPERLAEVARFVQEHDVSTIFFEELVSPEVAETIASETGAHTAMLSPLESEPQSGDYVDAMKDNLATLTEALDCG